MLMMMTLSYYNFFLFNHFQKKAKQANEREFKYQVSWSFEFEYSN